MKKLVITATQAAPGVWTYGIEVDGKTVLVNRIDADGPAFATVKSIESEEPRPVWADGDRPLYNQEDGTIHNGLPDRRRAKWIPASESSVEFIAPTVLDKADALLGEIERTLGRSARDIRRALYEEARKK